MVAEERTNDSGGTGAKGSRFGPGHGPASSVGAPSKRAPSDADAKRSQRRNAEAIDVRSGYGADSAISIRSFKLALTVSDSRSLSRRRKGAASRVSRFAGSS